MGGILQRAVVLWLLPALSFANSPWLDVPFFGQTEEGCGSAAMAMVMRYWMRAGASVKPENADAARIHSLLYEPSMKGIRGSAMAAYLKENAFSVFVISGDKSDIERHLERGRPLIVCLRGGRSSALLHFVVVVGVDAGRKRIILHDPARGAYRSEPESKFLSAWQTTDNWALLAIPQAPLQ